MLAPMDGMPLSSPTVAKRLQRPESFGWTLLDRYGVELGLAATIPRLKANGDKFLTFTDLRSGISESRWILLGPESDPQHLIEC